MAAIGNTIDVDKRMERRIETFIVLRFQNQLGTCALYLKAMKKSVLHLSLKQSLPNVSQYGRSYVKERLNITTNSIKLGKAAGLEGLYPEFIHFLGKRARL